MQNSLLRRTHSLKHFKIVVSKQQMYRQAGNSMVVDVLMGLLSELRHLHLI